MECGKGAAAGRRQLVSVECLLPQWLVELKCGIGEDLLARLRVDHGGPGGVARRRHRKAASQVANARETCCVCGELP
jgi:hypothetical protein